MSAADDYCLKAEAALKQADYIANRSGASDRHEWTAYHVAVAQVYATLALAAGRTATGEDTG